MSARARRGLVAGAVAAALFGPGAIEIVRLQWRQRRLDAQLRALAAQRAALAQEHARLQEDPTYVEGLIRSTFKVSKKNELVIPLDDAAARR
jgi:cell division protein FtsB